MKLSTAIFLLLIYAVVPSRADTSRMPTTYEELSPMLEKSLMQLPARRKARQRHVDSLKSRLASEARYEARTRLFREIITEFETLSLDSVMTVGSRAIEEGVAAGDRRFEQWVILNRAANAASTGIVSDAFREIENQFSNGILSENRGAAYAAMVKLSFGAAALCHNSMYAGEHIAKGRTYIDSLKLCHPEGAPINSLLEGVAGQIDGRDDLAAASYMEVIRSQRASSYEISRAAALLGLMRQRQGNHSEALYYLALGALYDVNSADLTGIALPWLGCALLESGDTGMGRVVLAAAIENAGVNGNIFQARLLSKEMPRAIVDYMTEQKAQRSRSYAAIGVLVLVAVAMGVGLCVFRSRLDAECRRSAALDGANTSKEEAMGAFLQISAAFQERLEEFARLARRKISAGQAEELLSLIKQGQPMEEAATKSFVAFDRGFTRLFPGFVGSLNALLEPEKRIATASDSSLTPELRVLAFQRMGIDDTAMVARFLGLSLNTVYTYRNKLRSRAVSRDTFDADVMKIGRV